jgi:small conductance mechanosensitive channel
VILDLGISRDNDVDRAMSILSDELNGMAAAPEWSESFLEPPAVFGLERIGETALVIRATAKVRSADRCAVQREALRRIKIRFDREGIHLPRVPLSVYRTDGEGTVA